MWTKAERETVCVALQRLADACQSRGAAARTDILSMLPALAERIGVGLSASADRYTDEIASFASLIEMADPMDGETLSLAREILLSLRAGLQQEAVRRLVFFLPYKASMWDSLESIWRAADQDPACEAVVVPIPWAEHAPDGSLKAWHAETELFPDDVPVQDWQAYSGERLSALHPDAIFIHNPYDGVNAVSSIAPPYCSDQLKTYTEHLYYVPYYSTSGAMGEAQADLPAYANVEVIFVQSESVRSYFHEKIRDKVIPLGSPKFDRIIRLDAQKPEPPASWKEQMASRRVYFFNTSLNGMLFDTEGFLDKIAYVLDCFSHAPDACLLWRPHPLLEQTFRSLRPEFLPRYLALKESFQENGRGIYDTSPDMDCAVAWSDVYIGDEATSMPSVFGAVGKPVFVLNNFIHTLPQEDMRRYMAFPLLASADGDWILLEDSQLLHAAHDYDFRRVCRLTDAAKGMPYICVVPWKGKAYVFPRNQIDIVVLEAGKVVRTIPLVRDGSGLFSYIQILQAGRFVCLLPQNAKTVVLFDLDSETVSYIEDFRHQQKALVDGEPIFGGSCVYQGRVVISSASSGRQFLLDPVTREVQTADLPDSNGMGYAALVSDGDEIWLLPLYGDRVLCWNPATQSLRTYHGFPSSFTCRHPVHHTEGALLRPFSSAMVTPHTVYLAPAWGNAFLRLDRRAGRFSIWDAPFPIIPPRQDGYHMTDVSGFFLPPRPEDGQEKRRYFDAVEHRIYQVKAMPDGKEKVEVIPVRVEAARDDSMAHGFDVLHDGMPYACQEDGLQTLPALLAGTLPGRPFSHERALAAFSRVAENLDGSAGEKIYRYAVSRMEGKEVAQ